MSNGSRDAAKMAKQKLGRALASVEQLRGIGIAAVRDGYGVKVNLSSRPENLDIPCEVDGVPVIVDIIGDVEAL